MMPMDREAARELAVGLMREHGLIEQGWRFRFNTRLRCRAGQILYGPKIIELATSHVDANGVEQVRDTVLHEIAHQKAGPGHGHDKVWKSWAVRLGARPYASNGPETEPPGYRWTASCCGNEFGWYGRPRTAWRCRHCGLSLRVVRA